MLLLLGRVFLVIRRLLMCFLLRGLSRLLLRAPEQLSIRVVVLLEFSDQALQGFFMLRVAILDRQL